MLLESMELEDKLYLDTAVKFFRKATSHHQGHGVSLPLQDHFEPCWRAAFAVGPLEPCSAAPILEVA